MKKRQLVLWLLMIWDIFCLIQYKELFLNVKKNRYEKIKVEVPEGVGELTPMENTNQDCVMGDFSPITKDNQFKEVGKNNLIKLKPSDLTHLNRFD